MKNITVSIDEDLYRRARMRAADEGRSVSNVVKETLTSFAAQPASGDRRQSELKRLFAVVDARLHGIAAEPIVRNWRDKMYGDRFDETILGRALIERDL